MDTSEFVCGRDKGVEELRVEVRAPVFAHEVDRVPELKCRLIDPLSRECVKGIGDGGNATLNGNGLALQPSRISCP